MNKIEIEITKLEALNDVIKEIDGLVNYEERYRLHDESEKVQLNAKVKIDTYKEIKEALIGAVQPVESECE